MLQLIKQFQKQGYSITFATTANVSNRAFNLESIEVSIQNIELNNSSFDAFIKLLNPTIVMFDRFMTEEQFGWRVAEQCPNALRILDTEDFHGLRKARGEALKADRALLIEDLQSDITKREIASIYRCDLSLIISEAEMKILTHQFKIDSHLLYYLPFLLEPIGETSISKLLSFKDREHFVTIGNFLHAPNYDAVLYLKQTIWPLIRKRLPHAELHVYGSYAQQKTLQLHQPKEGFYIKGFAENVNNVMQSAKICLASLRFGAGLKGKLVDAMKNGTPCIMSTIASEGMFGDLEENGCIEDNPEAFAEKAIALYTDEILWKTKQINGFNAINSRFNVADFETDFKSIIETLISNLIIHRQDNFTGQLLMHHSMQSTKYMSRWIETKQQLKE
ncbi:glycosyltransferase family 4 protein [Winogradskyella sp. E313]|uniref:Glycosyltransferase family 4 protein n=2 Tax=Winogradskyella immobilis TaxID=2816852 RepID=A0ABS8EK59_9FLAO|nr:glycosyltransferase family 4 protein [Winogradskyella immobilis]